MKSLALCALLVAGCTSDRGPEKAAPNANSELEGPTLLRDGRGDGAAILFYLGDKTPWNAPVNDHCLILAVWPDGEFLYGGFDDPAHHLGHAQPSHVADAVERMTAVIARVPPSARLCDYEREAYGIYSVRDATGRTWMMCGDEVESKDEPRYEAFQVCGTVLAALIGSTTTETYSGSPALTWRNGHGPLEAARTTR